MYNFINIVHTNNIKINTLGCDVMARDDLKRVIIIMEKDTHDELKTIADETEWTVSGICRKAIKDYLYDDVEVK